MVYAGVLFIIVGLFMQDMWEWQEHHIDRDDDEDDSQN